MDINAILEPIVAFLTSVIGEDGLDVVTGYIGQIIEFVMDLIG
jgi:hypothetical protein